MGEKRELHEVIKEYEEALELMSSGNIQFLMKKFVHDLKEIEIPDCDSCERIDPTNVPEKEDNL